MVKLITLILFFSGINSWGQAQNQPIDENPLSITSSSLTGDAAPGSRIKLDIQVNLKDGFYAYAERISIKFTEPNDITVGEIQLNPLVEFSDNAQSKKIKKGIKGKTFISALIEFPNSFSPQYEKITGALTYAACTKTYCLAPREVLFSAPVIYNHALAATNLKEPMAQVAPAWGSADYIKNTIEKNIVLALFFIFIFGLLSSLTPCIYPLIPITLAVIGSHSERGVSRFKAFILSVVYVHGLALTYSILGVIAAKTGGLFGSALSHPVVLIIIALLFFILALSMFGFFEIKTPLWIQNKLHAKKTDPDFLGVFFTGMVAGVVASPCIGPVLVGILAYIAQTQNAFLGFVLLFTFAMGLGVLLIIVGTFSSLVNRLPRSGPWMNLVKNGFAIMMLIVSGFYLNQAIGSKNFTASSESSQSKHMNWEKYSKEKVNEAKLSGKPVLIDFYADWCAACVELEKFTFVDSNVQELAKKFVLLKVDATEPFDELEALQDQYKVFGLPTIVFISAKGEVLFEKSLLGFEEAKLFTKRMNSVLE